MKKYTNTHFVSIMVEKPFYTRLEKTAEKLGTTPDVLISNALLLTPKKRVVVRAFITFCEKSNISDINNTKTLTGEIVGET